MAVKLVVSMTRTRTSGPREQALGTGSTTSGWNVEEALVRQKAEEEHVTCLLKVINP